MSIDRTLDSLFSQTFKIDVDQTVGMNFMCDRVSRRTDFGTLLLPAASQVADFATVKDVVGRVD
jgi:hypothetical protein